MQDPEVARLLYDIEKQADEIYHWIKTCKNYDGIVPGHTQALVMANAAIIKSDVAVIKARIKDA